MPALWRGAARHGDRIRVAYVSGDFRAHPLSQLMPGIFEQHDRSRFEVFGFSTGPDDGSPQRARVAAAFEHFVNVFDRGDDEIAAAIHERGIDIAVDLGGLTSGGRMRAFARRPAPVQVSYLGFPGPSGAPYLDYILADAIVIPPDQAAFYSEKPVWLPDTYYPNDDKRPIAPKQIGRSEAGLPRDGFVFCCFNNAYKLNPATFGAWMRMLLAVPGSVLWLYRSNPAMETNLRREASARGVDPARLVFAANLPPEQHLARHGLADLCLDTGPYNAHTTACDALWTGVPIVTWLGETFPSRVAGSVLHAIGLDELVAPSFAAYEALAIDLARNPVRLSRIRTKLADNRNTTPLFDTRRLTRHIESAYVTMAGRHRRGEPPAAFSVAPIA
jgi:predicted O-linked N-acetylglucosamine transferase (SPINDLY family)